MEKYIKVAALYIATLKSLALITQHNHWVTNGENFYGNHQLFERLYKDILINLDMAAEKFIGLFGEECLDYDLQNEFLNKLLSKYKNLEGSPAEMCLAAEQDFLKLSKEAYKIFEGEGKLTLGLDDAITAIAGKREEAVYLLKQTLK